MPNPAWARAVIRALGLLPLNAVSRVAGRAVGLRLPAPLQRAEIRLFGRLFDVAFEEARDPIESFACFQDFFTRRIRDDVRPIDPAEDAFVSPCDGAWGASGTITDGTILQLKGRPYALARLLGSEDDAHAFEGGTFATLYLSPRDYHRFHAPADALVERARYIPGALWPVNGLGLHGVDGLFAENERICAHFRLRATGAAVCLVAVGATMVGSVRVEFDDLATNRPGATSIDARYDDAEARAFTKGEEWGRFEFGSTIVVVAAPGVDLVLQPPDTPLRLGERIGTIKASSP
jgi:phosphatidylserine decarboxylase